MSFKDRIVVEMMELQEKITKLEAFIEGDMFKTLDAIDQQLLTTQVETMKAYNCILTVRLARL